MMITRGVNGKREEKGLPPDYHNSELKRILSQLLTERTHTSETRGK